MLGMLGGHDLQAEHLGKKKERVAKEAQRLAQEEERVAKEVALAEVAAARDEAEVERAAK